MKNLYILIIVLSTMLASESIVAQNAYSELSSQTKKLIMEELKKRFPKIRFESIDWTLDIQGSSIGVFDYNGRRIASTFSNNGKWLQSAEEMKMEDLPIPVRANITVEYGDNISSIERVNDRDYKEYYNVWLKDKNIPVRYDMTGTRIKDYSME